MTTPKGPYRYIVRDGHDNSPHFEIYCALDGRQFYRWDGELITARLNQQHAEIERLREALQSIVDMHNAYRVKMSSLDALLDYETVRTIADNALAQEASEQ